MLYQYKEHLKEPGRKLRQNMTEAERKLWRKIRNKQIKSYQFNRQKPISNFVLDFYCNKAQLDIEIDGGQHYEDENIEKDKLRDLKLNHLGVRVLRFTNLDILKNIDSVIKKIEDNLP